MGNACGKQATIDAAAKGGPSEGHGVGPSANGGITDQQGDEAGSGNGGGEGAGKALGPDPGGPAGGPHGDFSTIVRWLASLPTTFSDNVVDCDDEGSSSEDEGTAAAGATPSATSATTTTSSTTPAGGLRTGARSVAPPSPVVPRSVEVSSLMNSNSASMTEPHGAVSSSGSPPSVPAPWVSAAPVAGTHGDTALLVPPKGTMGHSGSGRAASGVGGGGERASMGDGNDSVSSRGGVSGTVSPMPASFRDASPKASLRPSS